MTTPLRPRTAAGRFLLAHLTSPPGDDAINARKAILAIEAEADNLAAEGLNTVWHYCDFDSRHHRAAEAAPDLRAALERLLAANESDPNEWLAARQQARAALRVDTQPLDTQGAPAVPVQPDDLAAPAADGLDVERVSIERRARLNDAYDALRAAVLWLHGEYRDRPRSEFNVESWYRKARSGNVGLAAYLHEPSREPGR